MYVPHAKVIIRLTANTFLNEEGARVIALCVEEAEVLSVVDIVNGAGGRRLSSRWSQILTSSLSASFGLNGLPGAFM